MKQKDFNVSNYAYTNTAKENKTIKKDKIDESRISPNALFKYASYNTIFTLSALTQDEIENPEKLLRSAPHDIIVRSGGIGNPSPSNKLSATNKEQIKSEAGQQALSDARENLKRGRDLYFSKVEMLNIPGLNEQRRATSVTKIQMTIAEPLGISLLDKMRGAAANCNYLDHIGAPYMLTMEFKGHDEFGNIISTKDQQALTRKIPIKVINMELNVNQGGTVYEVIAIPYNEGGFLNHNVYIRTSGTIKKGNSIQETMNSLADILNKQSEDEVKGQFKELPDTYEIVVDEFFHGMEVFGDPRMADIPVGPTVEKPKHLKAAQIKSNDNLLTIITELMKTLKIFTDNEGLEKFKEKIQSAEGDDMYFDYFMIESSVVPDANKFDRIRAIHPRKITFNIVPYKIHAYALADPGSSTGKYFGPYVKKEYNYIFTGDNVDILDLDIRYKVAYFQTKLKGVEGKGSGDVFAKNSPHRDEEINVAETNNAFADPPHIHQSQPGIIKTVSAGVNKGSTTALDQRLDALSNPTADMVVLNMTIMGDPAYIGQSQFIPTTAKKDVLEANKKKLQFSSGNRTIWNKIFGNYNMGFGDTVVKLNFRSPTDLNDKTGVYELAKDEQIAFSGFYRVHQVTNTFEEGQFTQNLLMSRFHNQGAKPYVPQAKKYVKFNIHNNYGPHIGGGLVEVGEYINEVSQVKDKFKSYVEGKIQLLKSKFNIGRLS